LADAQFERILALDPGWNTGWASWVDSDPVKQGVIRGGLMGFKEWVESVGPETDTLVIEDFIVEPSFVGQPYASEVKGAAIMSIPHKKLVIQKRADKATLFRENGKVATETRRFQRLREWGFSGVSHELDANTHAIIYRKRLRDPVVLARYFGIGTEATNEEAPE